jgi:hypothetical protein
LKKWTVAFHDEFEPEFDEFPAEVQDELFAEAAFIELLGPLTSRPHVDKLHGSGYANMKELRFEAMNDEWRVAFAFDPKQIAILLVARRQDRNQRKEVLQGTHRQGGCAFRAASGESEGRAKDRQ